MEKRQVKVGLEKEERHFSLEEGAVFEDLCPMVQDQYMGQITLAMANNQLFELADPIPKDVEEIVFYDTLNTDAYRTYMRSLSFVFIIAAKEIFPDKKILLEHSISGASYCSIREGGKILALDTHSRDAIEEKMRQIIAKDHPIVKTRKPIDQAIDLFEKMGREDKVALLRYRKLDYVTLYQVGDHMDSFYGFMVPSTGYLQTFALELFADGVVLVGPERGAAEILRNFVPQRKLSEAYMEAEAWSELQGITQVSDLNRVIEENKIGDVCRMAEALQQHKVMTIAQEIQSSNKRIILISAPSSSGKTSFAHTLTTSLRVLGLRPIFLSMDDYYVDRKDTPRKEDGSYDFESIYAVDLDLFNGDLNKLIHGQPIEEVRFNFVEGKRWITGEKLQIQAKDPIIIEGIHALNPILTNDIDDSFLYKIYLSVITQINLDDHNRIHTTDLRLMRRMARDKEFRGKRIQDTMLEWPKVRQGEKDNIFPFQEEADVVFNSSFLFEISMLKPILMEELLKIQPNDASYIEASRLISFLQYFHPVTDTSDVVSTSILREFIGGSKIIR